VIGVETEDAAEAALGLGDQEWRRIRCAVGLDFGEERGEVVVEGEDGFVGGIVDSAGTGVGGAEVACVVVAKARRGDGFGGLALPGTLGALGGDEDPLAEERVVAAVRDEVKRARRGGQRGSFRGGEATDTSVSEN